LGLNILKWSVDRFFRFEASEAAVRERISAKLFGVPLMSCKRYTDIWIIILCIAWGVGT
jgi:hypothetical protein